MTGEILTPQKPQKLFPIGHGTNYFRFVLTFDFFLHVNNCFSFLFVYGMCKKKAKNTYRFERFSEINYKADVPSRRNGLACEFSNFS